METGDGQTDELGGAPLNEENVIRLPREWLGPPEELVPIGPAARARAAQREAAGDIPTTADAFWSEDAAALHDAVQAPPAVRDRREPPAGLVPPVAGLRPIQRLRLPSLSAFGAVRRVSWRWTLLVVGVVVLSVVVLLAKSDGPALTHTGSAQLAARSGSKAAARGDSTTGAVAAQKQTRPTTRRPATVRAHTRTRARRSAPPKTRHRVSPQHLAPRSEPTVTEATSPAARPVSETRVSTPTTPSASTASTASTGGSTGSNATGPPGPTRLGTMSGGCTPKCP